MKNNFFINRPRFAIVIALVITLAGVISSQKLPLEEYPLITPPQIVAQASYPGASAEVIESTVAAPLEAAINGVEDMIYMSSTSTNGSYSLQVYFKVGTDPDMALINVQNRLNLAMPQLPEEVRRFGLYVKDKIDGPGLMIISFYSPDKTHDQAYISNFASIFVKDVLSRVEGVGEVQVFGGRDYSMRIWVNPAKMASLKVTSTDIINAIRSQNVEVPVGSVGQEPSVEKEKFQLNIKTTGRLKTAEEFENIVIKSDFNGANVKLKDIARVELGALSYSTIGRVNGSPAALMKIIQLSDANSIAVSEAIKKKMEEISASFPAGIEYQVVRDETDFIKKSMDEVVKTIIMAILFVAFITYAFFGDKRSSFIPVITMPVSLIGTLTALYIFDFSINTLTLFGLVLAVGTVVDDTIVVVENMQRHIKENKLSAKDAAVKTMHEVAGAVIATTLVLLAVFVPVGFIPGVTGKLYVQFAVGISIAVVISTLLALTLAPALSGAMLKKPEQDIKKRNRFLVFFETAFRRLTTVYLKAAKFFILKKSVTVSVFVSLIVFIILLFNAVPTGFLPREDKGVLFSIVNLPEGASVARTDEVVKKIEAQLMQVKGIKRVVSFGGHGGANQAIVVSQLDDWSKRVTPNLWLGPMLGKINKMFSAMPEAAIYTMSPPSIPGLGWFGGFELQLQDIGDNSPQFLSENAMKLMMEANNNSKIERLFTTYQSNYPEALVEIDIEKALSQGVPLTEIYSTLGGQFGRYYINDFNLLGRVFRVQMQADSQFRRTPEDIKKLYVRNIQGEMVPIETMVSVKNTVGPQTLNRFNMFRSVTMSGSAAPGCSSGEAIREMKKIADEVLPQDASYEWSGTAREEIESQGQTTYIIGLALMFVYLFLVALYESWTIPLAVMLVAPVAAIGGLLALYITNHEFNLYSQIGLIMLIGLATKHAILIVEFAKKEHETGTSIVNSALKAAGLRFRAVMMTVLSFIFGVLPLVFAMGAGAEARASIGITVFGGMIATAIIGTLLVPAFYVIIQTAAEKFTFKKPLALIPLIFILFISSPGLAEDSPTIQGGVEENIIFSLTECVDKALENNPEIKAAVSTTDIYHSKIGQARSNYFPQFSLSSGYSRLNPLVNNSSLRAPDVYYNSYNFSSISVEQLIFDFGKTADLLKASKLGHESSEHDLQAVINNVIYSVKEAYYKLLFAQKQLEVMQDTVNKFQQHLDQATAFYEVGTKPKIDVTTARFNLSNANLSLISAKNDIIMAYAALNNAMGLPKQVEYSIKDDLDYKKLDLQFNQIIQLAYDTRPDLKAAQLRTQASERLVKIAKKAVMPDIEASSAYNVGGGDFFDDYGFTFGLKLDLPLTNAYKTKKILDEAKAVLDQNTAVAQKLENEVFLQAKQAHTQIVEAGEKIPVSELLLEQAKENYELASGRYKVGLGDSIELKDAEIEYTKAQMQYFSSILEYNIAVANLERIVGTREIQQGEIQ